MRKGFSLFFVLIFSGVLTLFTPYSVHATEDAPDPLVLDQERRLKEDTERQAQLICDSILGKSMSSVLVNVELGIESSKKGGANFNQKLDNGKGSLGNDTFLLPWVPAPKSVTKEETPKDVNAQSQAAQTSTSDVRTIVKRFDLTVIHDKRIPQEQINSAKEALESAFDRFKDILKIYFKASSFVRDQYNPSETVKKNLFDSLNLKNLMFLFLLFLVFSLLKFFFGPLAKFMSDYIDGMKELSKSKVEMDTASETENETDENAEGENSTDGDMTPEELAALEAQQLEEVMQKFEPFTYITDENIKQLAYLLHHEEPWVVAMVISYLTSEHAFKVMEALPADLQAKVALETAMYRQTSHEQVAAINEDIKQKIDFVVGGLEKLINILENSDRMAQDNILEYLKNEKPAIYERVRENILLFEDIVNFPKMAMQVLVRELKTEDLGRAIRGVSPELQQKFFDSMSQGAVTLLKEEMQFGRPVTDEQIEEERKKIVEFVKVLEKDGKISFRQRGKLASLSGDEVGRDMAQVSTKLKGRAPHDPDAALNAYNAGLAASEAGDWETAVQQYEAAVQSDGTQAVYEQALANAYYSLGRYPEALTAYDQFLQMEPNPELQAWVEELRTSVQQAA